MNVGTAMILFLVSPLVCFGVLHLLSTISGWGVLAIRFPDQSEIARRTFRFCSIKIGGVNYGSCCRIDECLSGLRVNVFLLFRFRHATIFLPWDKLSAGKWRRSIFGGLVQLKIKDSPVREIVLPTRVLGQRKEHLTGSKGESC